MQKTSHLWVNGGELCCKENDEDDKHLATHQEPGQHSGDDNNDDGNDDDNNDTDDNLSTLSLRFAICPSV